ncbi:MAG: universal stress protein [Acidobacteriaceae bacterium]|nr:universal stress protein [Acidobacteriaceae bacterium]
MQRQRSERSCCWFTSSSPTEERLTAPQKSKYHAAASTSCKSSLGCNAAIQVVRGPVKEALLNLARQASADLLIIGRPLRHSAGRMRDLTYCIIRDSPCPVLSI